MPIFIDSPTLLDVTAGLFAGLISSACLHPLDTLKTKIMTNKSFANDYSVITTLSRVIREEGKMSLWRGLPAMLYQTAITSSGFALAYETIKRLSVSDGEANGGR